jgi:tetratricopeptide (TPR) repeat protein
MGKENHGKRDEKVLCRNCGSENSAGLVCCERCGARLFPVGHGGDDALAEARPLNTGKGKARGKIESWHVAIMLAVVAVVIVVFYVVENEERDPAPQLKLANDLHDTKKFPEAIEAYKKYLNQNPRDVDARVDLGICYYEQGDYRTARVEMLKALEINPKHQLAGYNLGIVSLRERDLGQARIWFEKTIAIDSTTEVAARSKMMIHQHSFPMKSN